MLDKLAEGRTTIAIAHRLSTAARADRVLVLDRGRLVQDGSHADLVDQDGQYAAHVRGLDHGDDGGMSRRVIPVVSAVTVRRRTGTGR